MNVSLFAFNLYSNMYNLLVFMLFISVKLIGFGQIYANPLF